RHHLALHSFPTRRSSDLKLLFNLAGALDQLKDLMAQPFFVKDAIDDVLAGELQRLPHHLVDGVEIPRHLVEPLRLEDEVGRLERSEEHTSELQSQSNLVC